MATGKLEKELKEIQHDLIASEVRYRKLFETAKDGILLIDPVTEKVIDANPFLLDMIGYSLDDVIGKKLWEIGAIKDIAASKALFKTLQEKGYAHYEGLPLQSKDGKEHEVEFVSNKYRIDGTKMIQCNIRDITDRKMAEKKTDTYLAELKDEFNLNNLINETTTCGVLIYNAKSGQCIFANSAAAKETGGSKEQLLSQNFREIKTWKKGGLLDAAEAAIATGLPQRAEQHIVTSFGKEAYLEAVFVSFIKGGERFLMVVIHDILRTKQMEEEMEKQMIELATANKAMVGRELKMMELKDQVEELKKQLAAK
jgi:PAS domain S-box-containing protein